MRQLIGAPMALATAGLLILAAPSLARDRPGTPTNLRVEQYSPTEVILHLTNTAGSGAIAFEFEMWLDGVRVDPETESRASHRAGGYLGNSNFQWLVSREKHGVALAPHKEFCFRAWSRTNGVERTAFDSASRVRSEQPSGTACLVLTPDKPVRPKDIRVYLAPSSVRKPVVNVGWEVPKFDVSKPIDRFTIERQETPGSSNYVVVRTRDHGRLEERSYEQSFAESLPAPPARGRYAYKVCAHNEAGSNCDYSYDPLDYEIPMIQGETGPRPELAVTTPRASNTRLFAAGGPQPQTTTRATAAAAASTAGTETMLCRGGPLMGWTTLPVAADARSQLSLIFQPTRAAPAANGEGLKPSECGIVGRSGYFPPNVRFEGGEEIKQRLAAADQYWSFKVHEKSGYFEAVNHVAIQGPPLVIAPTQQIQGESTMPKPRIAPR
jgi:hypothetical protein